MPEMWRDAGNTTDLTLLRFQEWRKHVDDNRLVFVVNAHCSQAVLAQWESHGAKALNEKPDNWQEWLDTVSVFK
jgi:hypothetical protein